MSDLFEKASQIYALQRGDRWKETPDPEASELNQIGYFRLKTKDGKTLLRIHQRDVDSELIAMTEKCKRNAAANAAAKEKADLQSKAAKLLFAKTLELVGGFWDGQVFYSDGTIILTNIYEKYDPYHEIPINEFNLELVSESNAKVVSRVFKGAIWGTGLGLLSGGLGLLGAGAGLLSPGGKTIVAMRLKQDESKGLLLRVDQKIFNELLAKSMC